MGSQGYYYAMEEAVQGQNLFQRVPFCLERITLQSKSKTFSHDGKTKADWAWQCGGSLIWERSAEAVTSEHQLTKRRSCSPDIGTLLHELEASPHSHYPAKIWTIGEISSPSDRHPWRLDKKSWIPKVPRLIDTEGSIWSFSEERARMILPMLIRSEPSWPLYPRHPNCIHFVTVSSVNHKASHVSPVNLYCEHYFCIRGNSTTASSITASYFRAKCKLVASTAMWFLL